MALELAITVRDYTDSINVQDVTGVYDVTDNPTGYGSPNGTIVGATSATLTFTMPDATSVVVDVYPSFPTDDDSYYEVTLDDLGIEFIESGYWTILYTVVISGTTYTETLTVFLTKNTQCCVDKRNLKTTPSTMNLEFAEETMLLNNMITSAIEADGMGLTDYAETMMEYVKSVCEGCCCC